VFLQRYTEVLHSKLQRLTHVLETVEKDRNARAIELQRLSALHQVFPSLFLFFLFFHDAFWAVLCLSASHQRFFLFPCFFLFPFFSPFFPPFFFMMPFLTCFASPPYRRGIPFSFLIFFSYKISCARGIHTHKRTRTHTYMYI